MRTLITPTSASSGSTLTISPWYESGHILCLTLQFCLGLEIICAVNPFVVLCLL